MFRFLSICTILFTIIVSDLANADDDWIGKPDSPAKPMKQGGESLLGPAMDVPGLKGAMIKLDAAKLSPYMHFSVDGKFVYLLDQEPGLLRRLSVPDFKLAGEVRIGSRCAQLAESRSGLLLFLDGKEQLWVIDPETLAVRKQFEVEGLLSVVSSRNSSYAFAKFRPAPNRGNDQLGVIDLGTGKVIRKAELKGWGKFPKIHPPQKNISMGVNSVSDFINLAMTPDGRYLLVTGRDLLQPRIYRYRVQGSRLDPEESQSFYYSPDVGIYNLRGSPWPLSVSDDSQYVGLWSSCQTIYKVNDFSKIILNLQDKIHPRRDILAFDRLSKKVYAVDENGFMVISPQGLVEKVYGHRDWGGSRYLIVHPDGGKVLLLTDSSLLWLEIIQNAASSESGPVATGRNGCQVCL